MKKFVIRLIEESSDYPEWDSRWVDGTEFKSVDAAESFAKGLNAYSWSKWESNHPDYTIDEKLWALDHAPAFIAEEKK